MIETAIVYIIILLCIVVVARRIYQQIKGKPVSSADKCSGGCSGCSSPQEHIDKIK